MKRSKNSKNYFQNASFDFLEFDPAFHDQLPKHYSFQLSTVF